MFLIPHIKSFCFILIFHEKGTFMHKFHNQSLLKVLKFRFCETNIRLPCAELTVALGNKKKSPKEKK